MMNSIMYSLLSGKDPQALNDVIELVDGTRIPGIILNIASDEIQFFSGKSDSRQLMSAESIGMLYIDNATISIPFPIAPPLENRKT